MADDTLSSAGRPTAAATGRVMRPAQEGTPVANVLRLRLSRVAGRVVLRVNRRCVQPSSTGDRAARRRAIGGRAAPSGTRERRGRISDKVGNACGTAVDRCATRDGAPPATKVDRTSSHGFLI